MFFYIYFLYIIQVYIHTIPILIFIKRGSLRGNAPNDIKKKKNKNIQIYKMTENSLVSRY